MALDFRGYADAYAKGRDKFDAVERPSNYTKLFGTPEHSFIKNTKRDLNASMDPLLQASMLDVKDWAGGAVDFSQMKSAGTAYMDWKRNLNKPMNFRAGNYARENNLDNFIAFKQQYDQQMAAYAPMVMNKLQNHQAMNHLSDTDMQHLLAQTPGLQNVLAQSPPQMDAQGMPVPPPSWIMPRQSYGNWAGQGANRLKTIAGGAAALGGGAYLGSKFLPKGAQAAGKSLISKIPKGALKAGKSLALFGAGTKGAGALAEAAANLGGASKKTKAIAKEGTEAVVSSLWTAVKVHGMSKIIKEVAKKGGVKLTARTLLKLGAGGLGGAFTGGAATVAMAAWTAKDLIDVYNIITKMK